MPHLTDRQRERERERERERDRQTETERQTGSLLASVDAVLGALHIGSRQRDIGDRAMRDAHCRPGTRGRGVCIV